MSAQRKELKSIVMGADVAALVEAQRETFSSQANVVMELAQNARRAGATRILINYDEQLRSLEVIDDGCGISDFNALIDLARSDWRDPDLVAEEAPYGMGAAAALYCASRITVESKAGLLSADTRAILNFEPVTIHPCTTEGTRVALIGLNRPITNMQKLFEGFPIPVILDGVECPRPHALTNEFIETPIGRMKVAPFSLGYVAYLQGFKVAGTSAGTIIHLDGKQFRGRAPDRQTLIDPDSSRKQIVSAVYAQQRKLFEQAKDAGRIEALTRRIEMLSQVGCLELLNDIPVLPVDLLAAFKPGYTGGLDFGEEGPWETINDLKALGITPKNNHITREDAESLFLVPLRPDYLEALFNYRAFLQEGIFDADYFMAFNTAQYLAASKAFSINLSLLDAGHWINSVPRLVNDLPAPSVQLTSRVAKFDSSVIAYDGSLLATGVITFDGALGATKSKNGLALVVHDSKPCLVLTERCQLWDALRCFSSYRTDFDQLDITARDSDIDTLNGEFRAAFLDDPTVFLLDAANGIGASAGGRKLRGKSFKVTFDKNGAATVTALAD